MENEIIAEFMGLIPDYMDSHLIVYKRGGFNNEIWRQNELKYHKSWDWLMPVIEKISNTEMTYKNVDKKFFPYPRTFGMKDDHGEFMFRFNVGQLFIEEKLIDAAYKAVINFIKNL